MVVRRVVLVGVGAVAVAAGGGAIPAAGDLPPRPPAVVVDRGVRITESVSSDLLSFDGPAVTATLTLVAGSQPQTAAVGVEPSTWPDPNTQGSPLRIVGQQITGAGHQTSSYASGGSGSEPGASLCVRGAPEYDGSGIDLALPANSTTRVSWRIALATAPWPAELTAVRWVIGVPASANSSSQITQRQAGPRRFDVRGPTGVEIRLRAGAGAHDPPVSAGFPYRTVDAEQSVTILGSTRPRLRHARITVAYASTVGSEHGTIGTVTTGSDGTFAIEWQPRAAGVETISAAVRHPPAGLLPDHSCDLALTVQ